MSVLDVVGSYYDAWMAGKGDFSAVPLAPDFACTGPVASFGTAEGFREMASQAGPMVGGHGRLPVGGGWEQPDGGQGPARASTNRST
jgi:hypothetical protein